MHKEMRANYIWGMLATIWFSILSSCLLFRNVKIKIYSIIILPFVFYGRETWSVIKGKAQTVLENRVLRRICGPKMDEVTGQWRKLHNGELNNLYSYPNIIRQIRSGRMRWAGHVAHMEVERRVYKVLVGKPEGERPLGRPRHRWRMESKWILGRLAGGSGFKL
jgi:hypothetical protein